MLTIVIILFCLLGTAITAEEAEKEGEYAGAFVIWIAIMSMVLNLRFYMTGFLPLSASIASGAVVFISMYLLGCGIDFWLKGIKKSDGKWLIGIGIISLILSLYVGSNLVTTGNMLVAGGLLLLFGLTTFLGYAIYAFKEPFPWVSK